TLKKFLGGGYEVEASMGHIRDLVKKDMGIGPDFEPHYEVLDEKKKVVGRLRAASKKADVIYLAPDPDREGEAIAWHIAQVLGKDPEKVRRVTFNEITKRAVLKALEEPRGIDERKVDAQQARRILDRLMGFRLSPLLWEKVKQGLSAGRVQSVALKMVCDRQEEIDVFVPEEYWNLSADLEAGEPPIFNARLHRIDGEKAKVENAEQAGEIVQALRAGRFRVAAVERKESKQHPGPPFITSRLQQDAARRFGFSVKRTMGIAQGLYEGKEIGSQGSVGLITYMRTDSTRVSEEALAEGRKYVAATYGEGSLPEKPNRYRSKKGAQDAHEAIRPTNFDLPPEKAQRYLKPEELKLYKLIWDRFVASQMKPAVFDVTQVDVENGRYLLRAQGKVLKSPGFLAVYQEAKDEDAAPEENGSDAAMPEVEAGEELTLIDLHSEQKFTQPPARYSEATLVKALEENGIGRPSTYAQILATLTDRDYVDRVEKRFAPTPLGKLVNRMLQGNFHDIINEGYTAELEQELDRIEEGGLQWKEALRRFNEQLSKDIEAAGDSMPNLKRDGLPLGETCPECGPTGGGGELLMKSGRFGLFVGCSRYPDCNYTRNLRPEGAEDEAEEDAPSAEEVPPCEKCGSPMALRRSRYGTFYGCSAYPQCKNIRKTAKEKQAEPKPTGVTCPECGPTGGGGTIHEKRSRRGKVFYSCDRFPDCKYAIWNKPVPRPCPRCDHPFLTEKTTKKKGPHLLCPNEGCDYEEPLEEPVPLPEAEEASGRAAQA
ncbi:MAG TPA: type I DNA topoisomerase, partial [Thermoanaerobaculia bacterium]|nr:type I DNA topoisomerase [Thermoanaerobaculia bacterium]